MSDDTNPTKREIMAAFGQRVYEYRDDEGNIYYSFTRAQNIISPPRRLKLQNKIGTHITRFLVKLRKLSESLAGDDENVG